jgi:hypothetical protein
MSKLPPWSGDNDWMERWVNEQLDERFGKPQPLDPGWGEPDGFEIEAAEHGDIEPLKKKYPHLAPYLRLPKRARGKRFKRAADIREEQAATDVWLIRDLWQEKYGRKNRSMHQGEITAEEIAARRWGVEESVIREILSQHGWLLRPD